MINFYFPIKLFKVDLWQMSNSEKSLGWHVASHIIEKECDFSFMINICIPYQSKAMLIGKSYNI